jgi:hypothetical protein
MIKFQHSNIFSQQQGYLKEKQEVKVVLLPHLPQASNLPK